MERSMEPDPLAVEDAPVDIRLEVEVDASPEQVWRLVSQVDRWPGWHVGVRFAALRGELVPGTLMQWRADGMRITSYVQEVEVERRFGFTLKTLGASGYFRWSLEPMLDGGTLVRSEEVWDGLGVRFLRRTLRKTLQRSRTSWLEALRDRVEGAGEERVEPEGEGRRPDG
jgi:uncharacterized protein YndB with AHSA1/START domain